MMELPPLITSQASPRVAVHDNGEYADIKLQVTHADTRMSDLHATQVVPKIQCMGWTDNFNPKNLYFPRQRIQKIGTVYVLVKSNYIEDNSYNNLHSNNLPGSVPFAGNLYQRDFEKVDITAGIFNARMQVHAVSIEKVLSSKVYEVNTLVQKYIRKVNNAINQENKYFNLLRRIYRLNVALNGLQKYMLPHLGKVYAEFVKCMRAWDEITRLWSSERMHHAQNTLNSLHKVITTKAIYAQDRMLRLTRTLILKRLHNMGELAAFFSINGIDNFELVFDVADLKRFCKLVEVFNHFITLRPKLFSPENHFCKVNIHENRESHRKIFHSIRGIGIEDIFDAFSGPTANGLSILFSQIFNDFLHEFQPSAKQFYWTDLLNLKLQSIQLDEGNVACGQAITNVIKGTQTQVVPFPDSIFANEISSVDILMKCQKQFLISFFSTLASSSSLLRKTLFSHNAQSARFTPSPIDDSMSVASSEDGANLLYHNSGIRKSVVWRDSWDMDSVMTVSNRCLQSVVQILPHKLISYLEKSEYDKTLFTPNISVVLPSKCFWTDKNTACLEMLIFNMSNWQLIPEMLIRCSNEAMGSMSILSILSHCDSMHAKVFAYSLASKPKQIPNSLGLDTNTYNMLQIIQAFLVALTKYPGHVEIAFEVLPQLEAVLNSTFAWIKKLIHHYISKVNIENTLGVCLKDLRDITENSLDCLQQVEVCHNVIESTRSSNLAGLHVATLHLKNIDSRITHFQELSTGGMKNFSQFLKIYCKEILEQFCPKPKIWMSKGASNNLKPNSYTQAMIENCIKPSCKVVKTLDLQSQMTVAPCVASCIFGCILDHIKDNKIKFSITGAELLKLDFECLIEYFLSDQCILRPDVQDALKRLRNIKQSFHVVDLLMSTSNQGNFHSTTSIDSEQDLEARENDKFWLSLRVHGSSVGARKPSWKSLLPCL